MSTKKQSERAEYAEKLRAHIKPGDTVYTVLRSVAPSGMSRTLDVVLIGEDRQPFRITYWVAKALGWTYDTKREALKVQGCGTDAGFETVYNLSRVLFPGGHGCAGEGCPSNDHSNGDRDYTPHLSDEDRKGADGTLCECHREHWHTDGGYALRHRWL